MRLLLMSGYAPGRTLRGGLLERKTVLEKPFTPADLLDRVRSELDKTVAK